MDDNTRPRNSLVPIVQFIGSNSFLSTYILQQNGSALHATPTRTLGSVWFSTNNHNHFYVLNFAFETLKNKLFIKEVLMPNLILAQDLLPLNRI